MYSCAQTRAVTPRYIPAANMNVERVLEIVEYFNPTVFWIENPTTGALKSQDIVQQLKRVNISYDMYSDWGYMKKTSLWTDHGMLQASIPKLCSHSNRCASYSARKHQLPIQVKYRILEALLIDVLACAKVEVIESKDLLDEF